MLGNSWVVLPLLWLIGGAFVLGLIGRLWHPANTLMASLTALICVGGVLLLVPPFAQARAALLTETSFPTWGTTSADRILQATPAALALTALALGIAACTAVYSGRYMARDRRYATSYPLLLLMLAGLLGMLLTTDLFNLYLFSELMSIAAYVLVAFRRHTDTSIEAGFKYLILGSVATLIMLLGVAWVYRETGSVALPLTEGHDGLWARLGTACFLVGLALKSGIVPLHTWLPDAYGRAPSSVSAVLASVISKSTVLVLLRVTLGLGLPAQQLGLLLVLVSFLNMTLGNVLALVQRNTKRLLAYSSIAQTGYIMFALGVGLHYDVPAALDAGFFLLLVHALLKALAFLSKGVCHFYCDTTQVEELQGTAQQLPLVAITFGVALAGLAGIPPLAGFTAKWFILAESITARDTLAYVGIGFFLLNSVLALGYYLPLIVRLFTPLETEDAERLRVSPWMGIPLLVLGALALAIGLQPTPWLQGAAWLAFF